MINSPIGIVKITIIDRSLSLIMAISPIMKPITPKVAIKGDGKGSLTEIPSDVIFMNINPVKNKVKMLAHFPVVFLDQKFSFMIIFLPLLFKAKAASDKLPVYLLIIS